MSPRSHDGCAVSMPAPGMTALGCSTVCFSLFLIFDPLWSLPGTMAGHLAATHRAVPSPSLHFASSVVKNYLKQNKNPED